MVYKESLDLTDIGYCMPKVSTGTLCTAVRSSYFQNKNKHKSAIFVLHTGSLITTTEEEKENKRSGVRYSRKNKTNMAIRYKWPELKQEYFASEHIDVKAWHQHAVGIVPPYNNSTFRTNTNGWFAEKQEWRKQKVQNTIQKMLEKESEENAKALINLLKHFQEIVGDPTLLKSMSVREKAELWKVWRVENKLPVNISNELVGEDPNNKFTSLADALKALELSKTNKDEPQA